MNSGTPIERGAAPREPDEAWTLRAVQRRRAAAALRRRRRLLLADLGLALLLAVIALALAPGLAVVALGAMLVLLGHAVSLAYERVRRRRAIRGRSAPGDWPVG